MYPIIKETVDFYGKDMQLNVCIEELSELIKEICKDKRGMLDPDHLAEEMADVHIIMQMLSYIYGNDFLVEKYLFEKTERLKKRLRDAKDDDATVNNRKQ